MIKNIDDYYTDPASSDYSAASSAIRFKRIFESLQINEISVLDYGCGPGNMTAWFTSIHQKPVFYYGYDIREQTIAVARQKNLGYRFETVLCCEPVIDLAVFAGTISYAFDADINKCKMVYEQELARAMDLLKPNGLIRATVRKIGYEYERKQNKKMLTYSIEELKKLGATNIYSLFDHEWVFDIKKEKQNE